MPYTYTQYKGTLDINFEGDHVVLQPGDSYPLNDPCQAIRFINAVNATNSGGVADHTNDGFEAMQEACEGSGGSEDGTPPPTPAPVDDPSTTDTGSTDGHETETAETLGCPAPDTSGSLEVDPQDPGTSDGRSLSEQYYSPVDPMQDYDVSDQLTEQGVSLADFDDAMQSVIHNDPPDGEAHPYFGLDDRGLAATIVADPVILFSGQFSLTATDVQIPTRGAPLHLTRMYHSGPVYFGPFGYNWDHNYNVYLRPLKDGGAAIWTGQLTEDHYQAGPDGFLSPLGVFRKLEHQVAATPNPERYVLSDREGTKQIFERPDGWPTGDRFPLVRIEDRHGNTQFLSYDDQGRLQQVADSDGRFLQLAYGDCGLLEQLTDHTGRLWTYVHDSDVEHLIAVKSPVTAQFPDGVITTYEYDRDQPQPALRHNIIRVTDPTGRVTVENQYGDDGTTDDFGRVVYQQYGGYEAVITTTRLQLVPRTPDAINVPAIRVEVVDPGILRVYTFNYRGDLLDERFRLVYDGSYRLVARVYRYDEQGNIIERREPNGLGMLYTFDSGNEDPRARGNVIKMELVPPPTSAAASRIIQILSYEPQFHRLKSVKDEGGGITTWFYDYEELTGTAGDVVRIEYPPATLPDGTSQQRIERFTYNAAGQLTEHRTGAGHRHVFTYAGAGSAAGYMASATLDADGIAQTESWEYDAQGHRSASIDGLGNRVEMVTDELDMLTSIRLPAVAGVADVISLFYAEDGQLKREEWPRGEYADGTISDPFIANEYAHDTFGNLTSITYGANTATPLTYSYVCDPNHNLLSMQDALGRRATFTYDERGLLLTMTEAAGTELEAVWHYSYDRNGNRTAVTDPVGHRVDYEYDEWDRLRRVTLQGSPDAERTRIDFTLNRFDRADRIQITGLISPGVTGSLLDSYTDYDERGRPWRRRLSGRGTVFTYDADERVVLKTDQRGSATAFAYDGLNRIVKGTDALGNALLRTFDAAGNLTGIERQEMLPDGAGMESLHWSMNYDVRRRPITVRAPLGQVSQTVYDARNMAVSTVDPLGREVKRAFGLRGELLSVTSPVDGGITATHAFTYDAVGRQIAYTDPEGQITSYTFDDRDRRTEITYPDGRVHRFIYGIRRQPAQEVTPGGTIKTYSYAADAGLARIDFTPAPGVAPTPSLLLFSDGLRRPAALTQGGQTLSRTFDSSLRLTSESWAGRTASLVYDDAAGTALLHYPDGRENLLTFDPLGRISAITLATAGSLTGPLASGSTLAHYIYRGPSRLARRELHTGVVSSLGYDGGARMTAIEHSDGGGNQLSIARYVYDAVDRRGIAWSGPLPQTPMRFDFDGVDRLREVALGVSIAEPGTNLTQSAADAILTAAHGLAGTASETYDLNLSDARTGWTITGPTGTTTHNYTLTAAHEIQQDSRTGTDAGVSPFSFDGDGRCTQDDRFQYVYDALGQLVEVKALPGLNTVLTQEFDPAGRVIRRTDGADSYRQTHLGYRLLSRDDTAGNPTLQFTGGIGIDEVVMESTGTNRYPLQDGASNVFAYTGAAGDVLERYSYSPFGVASIWKPDGSAEVSASAIGGVPRFGGHPLLALGIYDARARVYEPRTGRFLQPDPMGYRDASNLYTYAHHDPANFVDPTGELAILVGLIVAAGAGLAIGAGADAIHQGLQIHEGSRDEFSWGELGFSAGAGALMGPVVVFAPEVGVPLAAYGAGQGINEIRQGNWESGSFDVLISVAPFGFKGARTAAVGEGSVFSPARGLGPSATAAARFGRFGELGRATNEMVGQVWNDRFYRGTTYYKAIEAEQGNFDLERLRSRQSTAPAPPRLGPGLYMTRDPGVGVPGGASYWADFHGGTGKGGGPAVLEGSIPRWKLFLLRREPGVQIDIEQPGFPPHPSAQESFFPFEGPMDQPPNGPAARFNAAGRWKIWDPNATAPNLDSLLPSMTIGNARWPSSPGKDKGSK